MIPGYWSRQWFMIFLSCETSFILQMQAMDYRKAFSLLIRE